MRKIKLMILLSTSVLIIFAVGCREGLNTPIDPTTIRSGTISPWKHIRIILPEDDNLYYPGQRALIKWSADSGLSKVNIKLYRKNAYQRTIITNLDNTGEYQWFIPINIDKSTKYRLKVENSLNINDFDISNFFRILEWGIGERIPLK